MSTMTASEITLSLLVKIEAVGGRYRALCPAIEVASAGRTIDEALTNVNEAVEARLEDWRGQGILLEELARRGVGVVEGRHKDLSAHAEIVPGILAVVLNQSLRVA